MTIPVSDERVNVDGADFSFLTVLLGGAVNSILYLLYLVVSFLVVIVYSLIAFLTFGLVGLSKKRFMCEMEYRFYQYICYVRGGLSILISSIMSRGTNLLIIAGLNAFWVLPAYFFVIRRAKKMLEQPDEKGLL